MRWVSHGYLRTHNKQPKIIKQSYTPKSKQTIISLCRMVDKGRNHFSLLQRIYLQIYHFSIFLPILLIWMKWIYFSKKINDYTNRIDDVTMQQLFITLMKNFFFLNHRLDNMYPKPIKKWNKNMIKKCIPPKLKWFLSKVDMS